MRLKKLSLRFRIFIAMILLVIIASILIAAVTIYQYREETREYHQERLTRKERSIKRHINFVIRETTYEVTTEKLPLIFKEEIYKIADVHNLQLNLYDLEGGLLISSKAVLSPDSTATKCLEAKILNHLSQTSERRYVEKNFEGGRVFQSSYSYITDSKFKPLGILNLPYLEDDDFFTNELNEFLKRLALAYLFMLILAIILAYWLSKYITKSLKAISEKMKATRFEKRNEKIEVESSSEEIENLVRAYNSMIDELEESAVKLATSEREQAWREMAKQVAHEIKNPLTPMRLSVQSFQHKFDANDPDIDKKVNEYSKTLIQQIDTMSSIASAFSNFAKMPAQKNEMLNVVEITKLALDIFSEDYIHFTFEKETILAKLDRTQLIRVVTNLVKNSTQAFPEYQENKTILVNVSERNHQVIITISDNGSGISEENKTKIFEPKFTTKSSGMGLGLAMVKNIVETYQGSITFTTEKDKGTTFKVIFPTE